MPLVVVARCTGQRIIDRRFALSTEIDRDFMESLGFSEDGDGNGELGLMILSEGETEWNGEGPAHQLVWSSTDGSLFLEAFTGDGDSLAITEIPKPKTREDVVQLLKLLGAYRPTLHDHVSRELAKYMPTVTVTKFDYVTVFQGWSEVVVYGSGSDWQVQYSKVTNDVDGYWRRWFSDRSKAEEWAGEIATEDYCGPMWKRWRAGK